MPQKVDSVLPIPLQIADMISRNAEGSGLSSSSSGFEGGRKVQDLFCLDSCDYEH